MKGFGSKPQPQIRHQSYTAELKRRYLTDNSELLLGTAKIKVPKTLHDPTGQSLTKREVWDAFAKAVTYCIISSETGMKKGCNQIFLFDSSWNLIERLETNWWEEKSFPAVHKQDLDDSAASIAWEAYQRCDVQVEWLQTPIAA